MMKLTVLKLFIFMTIFAILCDDFCYGERNKTPRKRSRRRRPSSSRRQGKTWRMNSNSRKTSSYDVQQLEQSQTHIESDINFQQRLNGVVLQRPPHTRKGTFESIGSQQERRSLDDFIAQLLGETGNLVTPSLVNKPKPLEQPHSGQWIRLRGSGTFMNAGIVEVYRTGQWGVICDDSWDLKDASVACRQLGFDGVATSSEEGTETVPASLWDRRPILMDEMQCTGSESRLQDCVYSSQHDCSLTEAAGITCSLMNDCPDGWFGTQGKCYKLFATAKGIKKAANVCSGYNASLVNIESDLENHFLSDVLKKSTKEAHYWYTGGRKTKNAWKWYKLIRRRKSRRGKNRKNKKSRTRSAFRTKRARMTDDQWFPGWANTSPHLEEPVVKRKHDCLVLSDEYQHPERGKVVVDYFFWRAMPCRRRGGIHFICQLEVKQETPKELLTDCSSGNGVDYRGEVKNTQTGTPCLSWSDSKVANDRTHPGMGLGDHSYCRNPDEDKGPWCWVDHTQRKFGYCDITQCSTVTTSKPEQPTTTVPSDPNCPDSEFYCAKQRLCIPGEFRCDNEDDCTFGEDEENCEYKLQVFIKSENSRLSLWNPETVYTVAAYVDISDERCAQICAETTDFLCRSFTYQSLNRTCQMSTMNSRRGSIQASNNDDYYELTSQLDCSDKFECDNGFCVNGSVLCDGKDDCKDFSDETNCGQEESSEVEVVLVGDEEHSGTVTVTYKGTTGVICDDNWDLLDAQVVCRMLGYRGATQAYQMNAFDYPPAKSVFMLDDVQCEGDEASLADCPKSKWKQHDCKAYEIAGVVCRISKVCELNQFKCQNNECVRAQTVCDGSDDCGDNSDEMECKYVEFHLVNGTTLGEGRVEVIRNGLSGTLCDDQWDDTDAKVLCQMMGFQFGGEALREAAMGLGDGPVWLDNINCEGNEMSLIECEHAGWGKHDCDHSEDAAVRCYTEPLATTKPTTTPPTTATTTTTTTTTPTTKRPTTTVKSTTPEFSIQVSLEGGTGSHEGTVVLTVNGVKYHVCDDYWEDTDASVVCRSLGYLSGGTATEESYFSSDRRTPILLDNVDCVGTESDLLECKAIVGENKHDCQKTELAGVICNRLFGTTVSTVSAQTSPKVDTTGTCGQRPYDYMDLLSRRRRSPITHSGGAPISTDDFLAPRQLERANLLKVVGGRFATHGAFPWQVRVHKVHSVRPDGSIYGSHHCGAVIISEYWLLSAAHCFHGRRKSEFRMVVGDHHQTQPDKGEQMFAVDQLVLHARYSDETKNNDIALIKILPNSGRGIQYNNYVQPVCLPDINTPHAEGTRCFISGWGNTQSGNKYPMTLKAARVPLISQSRCQYLYDPRRLGQYTNSMMCAGYEEGGIDTCDGDSGGPLVCNIKGLYILFGVTSWGRGCAQPGAPGVYARVASFLPWIHTTIQTNSGTTQQKKLPKRPF